MGRSVSYPSEATVVTFRWADEAISEDPFGFEGLIEDFRQHLKHLFPSVEDADKWIGREDHALAGNKLALFGMSEYCGLVSYWIVPQTLGVYDQLSYGLCEAWIRKIADKFVAAFGELSKVGNMSNGEGVYRRIDK